MRKNSSVCEALDQRRYLAGSVLLTPNGLLHVVGPESDVANVTVEASGENYDVNLNGATSSFLTSKVHSLLVETGTQDDEIIVDSGVNVPATIRGGAGADTMLSADPHTLMLSDYEDAQLDLSAGGVLKYQWEGDGPTPSHIDFGILVEDEGSNEFHLDLEANVPGIGPLDTGMTYHPNQTLSFTSAPDNVDVGGILPLMLDLGGGNDTVTLHSDSPRAGDVLTVTGGNGNDTLVTEKSGSYLLDGGKGDDTLISDVNATVTMMGGSGIDTADYSSRTAPLNITLDNKSNDGQAGEHDDIMSDVENILGGSGDDRIVGDSAANYIAGNGGADTIYGQDGNDTLVGGGGKDRLFGENGDDQLQARHGSADFLDGGDGNDSASYDMGIDTVVHVEKVIP